MTILNILRNNADVRSYSGRFMYGKKCPAVTCESIADILKEAVETILIDYDDETIDIDERDNLIDSLFNYSLDNMGRDMVIYWPKEKWEDEGS